MNRGVDGQATNMNCVPQTPVKNKIMSENAGVGCFLHGVEEICLPVVETVGERAHFVREMRDLTACLTIFLIVG